MKKNTNQEYPDNTKKRHPILSAIWKGIKFLASEFWYWFNDPKWCPTGIFCFESDRRSYQRMSEEDKARLRAKIESLDDGIKKDPENKQC